MKRPLSRAEMNIAPEIGNRGQMKREIGADIFERRDVTRLLERIRDNDKDYTVILKVKDQVSADINQLVMDEIIASLWTNKVCQVAYIQNLGLAIQNEQIEGLIQLLIKRPIWALNIGETYNVSKEMWQKFCDKLPETSVTHLYVSEHTIDLKLKNKMRAHIRENRKKHTKHSSMRNLAVIERCTNMWWNPINTIRHQLEAKWQAKEDAKEAKRLEREEEKQAENDAKKRKIDRRADAARDAEDDRHTSYWAQGFGEGGNTAWRFECSCLEVCSSYENFRYHPTGRQFQCTHCTKWAHVTCIFGSNVTDESLEDNKELLCHKCSATKRRSRITEMKDLDVDYDRIFGDDDAVVNGVGGSAGGAFDNLVDYYSSEDDDDDHGNDDDENTKAKRGISKETKRCRFIIAESDHPVKLWSNLWMYLRTLQWKAVYRVESKDLDVHVPSWSQHHLINNHKFDTNNPNLRENYDYFLTKECVIAYIKKFGPVERRRPNKPMEAQAQQLTAAATMEIVEAEATETA